MTYEMTKLVSKQYLDALVVASKTYQKLSIFNSGLEDLQVLYLIGKALISYYSDPSL